MKQGYPEWWPRPPPEVVSSALEWVGRHLDLRCPPPVVSSSALQRRSTQLGLMLRGKQKQKAPPYDVGGLQHTRLDLCLFHRQSEDLCLGGRPGVLQRLFCAIDRNFCFCWYQCCFWVGLTLLSEWVSMGWDRRVGCTEFSAIRPKVGGGAPKLQGDDTRGGGEP